jgi:hypothetical protein
MLDSQLLAAAGEALYGPLWQSQLARDLDVADRTVRRWRAGDTPIPGGVAIDLLRLLTERAADIDELIERLRKAAVP